MKWLKRIFITLLALVLILVLGSFLLSKTGHVERSIVINTKPATVFNIVNNLKSYDSWMTWNQMDPNWHVQVSENPVGKGASYEWTSDNSDVGSGSMVITDSQPNEHVKSRLSFEGMGSSDCGYQITSEGNATKVRWYMDTDFTQGGFIHGVMAKWMTSLGLFDKMVGAQFNKSLQNMKKLAEGMDASQY